MTGYWAAVSLAKIGLRYSRYKSKQKNELEIRKKLEEEKTNIILRNVLITKELSAMSDEEFFTSSKAFELTQEQKQLDSRLEEINKKLSYYK